MCHQVKHRFFYRLTNKKREIYILLACEMAIINVIGRCNCTEFVKDGNCITIFNEIAKN